MKNTIYTALLMGLVLVSCQNPEPNTIQNPDLVYAKYEPKESDLPISRGDYKNKLEGFWLGQCIANWTGLVTEMDKIGNIGAIKTGDFYTREDWGKPDIPNIFSGDKISQWSPTIDFVLEDEGGVWGADDDTDIEYIYQELLLENKTSLLSGEQIRDGWLKHIKKEEENYLWVSNQKALDLMNEGLVPPATGAPENNPEYEMIDAQLTTEVFGFYAPSRPDVAMKLSLLPIQTVARDDAQLISEFNVIMYSLASSIDESKPIAENIKWMATEARKHLPNDTYSAKMYDFVKSQYETEKTWEEARDAVYERYQVNQEDGYDMTSRNIYCNACFAAGINFAASIVSLYYGEGDLKETIKIGSLCGWDSDNPTATWGGLIGFMIGKNGVEEVFGSKFADKFNIHRTRIGFPNNGIDSFPNMANKGVYIIDRVVQEELGGGIDLEKDLWYIPQTK